MPVKSFTIDRSRWLRGDLDTSTLRNFYDQQCCLGFYLSACGVPDSALMDIPFPSDVEDGLPDEAQWLVMNQSRDDMSEAAIVSSRACKDLVEVNDSKRFAESVREAEIARLFAEQGIAVTFVDGGGE